MAKVVMYPGDTLLVQFSDTVGEFTIDFDTQTYPQQLVVRESDGMPGNRVGAAHAILYHEDFRSAVDPDDVASEEPPPKRVGFFVDEDGNIRCTEFTRCLVRELPSGRLAVVTLDNELNENGEFTFHPDVESIVAILGHQPKFAI